MAVNPPTTVRLSDKDLAQLAALRQTEDRPRCPTPKEPRFGGMFTAYDYKLGSVEVPYCGNNGYSPADIRVWPPKTTQKRVEAYVLNLHDEACSAPLPKEFKLEIGASYLYVVGVRSCKRCWSGLG